MKKLLISLLVVFTAFSILGAAELQAERTVGNPTSRDTREEGELGFYTNYADNAIGLTDGGAVSVGIRLTDAELVDFIGGTINEVNIIVQANTTEATVRVYEGATDTTTGTQLFEQVVTDLVQNDWNTVSLDSPIAIVDGTEYWVTYELTHAAGDFPLSCDEGAAVNGKGNMISMDGSSWDALYDLAPSLDFNWMISATVQSEPAEHDVKAYEIVGLEGNLEAGEEMIPVVKIKNIGLNTDTCTATLTIVDLEDTEVYNETSADTSVEVAEVASIEMPAFTPEAGKYYTATFTANLDTDTATDNNELEASFTAYITDREFVVAEVVTGTWCGYCPGAALAMDEFEANGDNVAIIEYHSGTATVDDPYETPFSSGRIAYYGVSSFPTSIFDGVNSYGGGNATTSIYSTLFPLYEERANTKTAMTLNVTDATRSDFAIDAVITMEGQVPEGDYRLHVAINESHIQEVWQGQTELNFVNRIMTPNHIGMALDFVDGVATKNIEFSDLGWNIDNCEVVVFVQENDTKEIWQATKLPLNSLIPLDASTDAPEMKLELSNYPNPFNPTTTINFNLPTEGQVSLEVFNAKGQKVNTLVNEVKSAGTHSVVWSGTDSRGGGLTSGVYYYKIKSGKFTSTKKMILLK